MADREAGGEWITVPAAARLLGLEHNTVYRLVDDGVLPAELSTRTVMKRKGRAGDQHPVEQRTVLVRRQDAGDFIERSRVTPGTLRHLYPEWTGRALPVASRPCGL